MFGLVYLRVGGGDAGHSSNGYLDTFGGSDSVDGMIEAPFASFILTEHQANGAGADEHFGKRDGETEDNADRNVHRLPNGNGGFHCGEASVFCGGLSKRIGVATGD